MGLRRSQRMFRVVILQYDDSARGKIIINDERGNVVKSIDVLDLLDMDYPWKDPAFLALIGGK